LRFLRLIIYLYLNKIKFIIRIIYKVDKGNNKNVLSKNAPTQSIFEFEITKERAEEIAIEIITD
jgi:hypothetical protein